MHDGYESIMRSDYSPFVIAIVYCIAKLLSLSLVWVSGYFAERDVNEAFTRLVYLERKAPPDLSRILVAMVALVSVFMLVMYLCSNTSAEMVIVALWLIFDAGMTVLIMLAIGSAVTKNVSDQKYFNYRTEGLRAIRSVRKMLVGTMLVVSLFPFATAITAKTTNGTVAKILSSQVLRNAWRKNQAGRS
jgi:MFS family permease